MAFMTRTVTSVLASYDAVIAMVSLSLFSMRIIPPSQDVYSQVCDTDAC